MVYQEKSSCHLYKGHRMVAAFMRGAMITCLVAMALLCCACSSSGVRLEQHSIGDFIIGVPAGWECDNDGDTMDCQPKGSSRSITDLYSTHITVIHLEAEEFDNQNVTDDWVESTVDRFIDSAESEGYELKSRQPATRDGIYTVANLYMTKGSDALLIMAAQGPTDFYRAIVSVDSSECENPDLLVQEINHSIKLS